MTQEVRFASQYTHCRETDTPDFAPGLLCYQSPLSSTKYEIEVRASGAISDSRRGKRRNVFCGVSIGVAEAKQLITSLEMFVKANTL